MGREQFYENPNYWLIRHYHCCHHSITTSIGYGETSSCCFFVFDQPVYILIQCATLSLDLELLMSRPGSRGSRKGSSNKKGLQILQAFHDIPCKKGVLGFTDYINHFSNAVIRCREDEDASIPPPRMLSNIIRDKCSNPWIKGKIIEYVNTNGDKMDVDELMTEIIDIVNMYYQAKGAGCDDVSKHMMS